MELGEIFDTGFRIWKENIRVGLLFIASNLLSIAVIIISLLAAMYVIGFDVIELMLSGGSERELFNYVVNTLPAVIAIVFVGFLLSFVVYEFFNLAAIKACSLAIDGRMDLGNAIKYARRKLLTMIFAEILRLIIVFSPFLLVLAAFIHPSLGGFIFSAVAFFVLFILFLILLVYTPYAVAEGYGATESIVASFHVARNRLGETLVILIVAILIHAACNMVGQMFSYISSLNLNAYPYTYPYSNSPPPDLMPVLAVAGVSYLISILFSSFIARPLESLFFLLSFRDATGKTSGDSEEDSETSNGTA